MSSINSIQILTVHEGNGGNYCPEVNNRPMLNFTEGAIIFYHSLNKRAVNICFMHHIHRFFNPYRTWKKVVEFKIRQL